MGNEESHPLPSSGKRLENDVIITWRSLKRCPFQSREGQSCASFGKNMYIFGGVVCNDFANGTGEATNQETNQLIIINTEKLKWREVTNKGEVPTPRSGSSLAAVGNKLYMFGGLSEDSGWLNDLYVFDTGSENWARFSNVKGIQPSPRDKLTSAVIGRDIYFFGGFGPDPVPSDELENIIEDDGDEEYEDEEIQEIEQEQQAAKFTWFNDLYKFDTELIQWHHLSAMKTVNAAVPSPRAAHTMCVLDGNLVVFGGRDSLGRQNDIWLFSSISNEWKELKPVGCKPEPRSFHASAAAGKRMVVLGGRGVDNRHFRDFHIYDSETNQWLQPAFGGDVMPPSMGMHSLSVVEEDIVLCFGTSDLDPITNSCTKYHQESYAVAVANVLSGGVLISDEPSKEENDSREQNMLPGYLNLQSTSVNNKNGV